jgi:hypothetical protein
MNALEEGERRRRNQTIRRLHREPCGQGCIQGRAPQAMVPRAISDNQLDAIGWTNGGFRITLKLNLSDKEVEQPLNRPGIPGDHLV